MSVRPEDVHVTVEHLNPSFLVKKRNGSNRLVMEYTDVGRYSKPPPAFMPDVDSTLHKIRRVETHNVHRRPPRHINLT